jgi:hypothetical protein
MPSRNHDSASNGKVAVQASFYHCWKKKIKQYLKPTVTQSVIIGIMQGWSIGRRVTVTGIG